MHIYTKVLVRLQPVRTFWTFSAPAAHAKILLFTAWEPLWHAKTFLFTAREPLWHSKTPLFTAREPLWHSKWPLGTARVLLERLTSVSEKNKWEHL